MKGANDTRFPSWLPMITLWMETHYKGKACVVFSNPTEYVALLEAHFPESSADLVMGSYAILVCKDVAMAVRICDATPDSAPFTMVWAGEKFTHENT